MNTIDAGLSRRPYRRATILGLFAALLLPGSSRALPIPYGAAGLSPVHSQFFSNPDLPPYPAESGDGFGSSLAVGDFNGDGADDLATGAPYDNGPESSPHAGVGAVFIRWGIPGSGLAPGAATTILNQYAAGSPDLPEDGDLFGFALAAGDFNFDGRDDLAVGTINDGDPEGFYKGSVQIFYGHTGGIDLAGGQYLQLGRGGLPGPNNVGDNFGYSLAVGDFDGDFYADLAIGAPHATVSGVSGAGAVLVIHGGASGLDPAASLVVTQDEVGIPDAAEDYDLFGFALAAGNFNGDWNCPPLSFCAPYIDLAIGVPAENDTQGAVLVLLGGPGSLMPPTYAWLGRSETGSADELNATFGGYLVAGDLDHDGFDELVISACNEDVEHADGSVTVDAGEITVVWGRSAEPWFDLARTEHWNQEGLFGLAEMSWPDEFAVGMATGDFDHDGKQELAIGGSADVSAGPQWGEVDVLQWTPGVGLTAARILRSGVAGVPPGAPQNGQLFGAAIATGDFDGDSFGDLAIGIQWRDDVEGTPDVGAETILYGSLFSDGFDGGSVTW